MGWADGMGCDWMRLDGDTFRPAHSLPPPICCGASHCACADTPVVG